MNPEADLYRIIRASIPVFLGLCVLDAARAVEPGWIVITSQGLRIRLDGPLTTANVTTAQGICDGFDWSAAAARAREDARKPERTNLRGAAAQAVSDINDYLLIADTATAAQVRTMTKRLAQMNKLIIIRLTQLD